MLLLLLLLLLLVETLWIGMAYIGAIVAAAFRCFMAVKVLSLSLALSSYT
jgi:hypothetical protein